MRKALVVLMLLMACRDVPHTIPATRNAPQIAPTPARRCGFAIDVSSSILPEVRQRLIERIATSLAPYADELGCTTISIAAFTDRGLFTDVTQYTLPPPVHAPCNAAAPTPSSRVLRAFDGYQQLTDKRCQEQRERETQHHVVARAAVLANVRDALDQLTTRPCACTDIMGFLALLQRISRPADVDLIITDAAHTCDVPATPVSTRGRVIFVLVPRNGEPRAGDAANRATHITSLLPGSTYVVPAELDGAHWWSDVVP